MKQAVRVICFYRGPRRPINNNPRTNAETIAMHNRLLEAEYRDTYHDTIFVENREEPGDGVQTIGLPGKTVKWLERRNSGASFAAYATAFEKYGDLYDWWMFQEDDVLMIVPGVFERCVEFLKKNPDVGWVALAPISDDPHPIHSGGGFGVASRGTLQRVAAANGGRLPCNESMDYPHFEESEWKFTNAIHALGLRLANLPGASPLADNWWLHESQRKFAGQFEDLPYIYTVGPLKEKR